MKKIFTILFVLVAIINTKANEKLSLNQAIAQGLKNNYAVIIQKERVASSKINNSWGNTGALPNLDFSISYTYINNSGDRQPESANNMAMSINLTNLNIFNGFAVFIEKTRLEELESLASGNYDILIENTIEQIMLAYYNVLVQRENMKTSEIAMNLSKDLFQISTKKFEQGNTNSYQLLQDKISYLQDKNAYLSNTSTYINSIRDLNYLMGVKEDKRYQFSDSLSVPIQELNLADMLARLESNNNTIKTQFINLEISKLNIEKAKSGYYPTLGANIGYSFNNENTYSSSAADISSSYAGLNASIKLNYTLFDAGTRSRALDIAKIENRQQEVSLEDKKHSLKNELLKLYQNYELNSQMSISADEQLEASKLNLKLSAKKFSMGVINSFNYRDIQSIYSSSGLNSTKTKYELIKNWIALLKITGGIIQRYAGKE